MAPNAIPSLKPGGGADSSGSPPSEQPQALNASAAPASATPLASTPPPSSRGHISKAVAAGGKAAGYGARKAGPGGSSNWYDGDASTTIGPDVLLVFCDVSPEATKKKAFDKVLAANGIISRVQGEPKDNGRELGNHYEYVGNAKADGQDGLAKHLPAGVVRRKAVVGDAELVYVEATALQVKATLASLSAQPKVFVSVSVKSAQDETARQLIRNFAISGEKERRANVAQSPNAAGAFGGSPPAAAKSASPSPSKRASQSQSDTVAQQVVPAAQAAGVAEEATAQEQQRSQSASPPSHAQSAPRQRVLFVVRIGGGASPVASQVGGQPGDNAKQPPAAVPAGPVPPK